MLRLCQDRCWAAGTSVDRTGDRHALAARAHRLPAADLRSVALYTRVARHNAAPLLITRCAAGSAVAGRAGSCSARPHPARGRPAAAAGRARGYYYSRLGECSTPTRCCASSSTPPDNLAGPAGRAAARELVRRSETRGLPPTGRCICGSSTRSATAAGPTRSPRWSGSRPAPGAVPDDTYGHRLRAARRAIEALRSGVPAGAGAVTALGSGQPAIEDRFSTLIDGGDRRHRIRRAAPRWRVRLGQEPRLEHLAHLALHAGFAVTSRVVVSKETPLHDPAKVLRAAVERRSARPRRAGRCGSRGGRGRWILTGRPSPS